MRLPTLRDARQLFARAPKANGVSTSVSIVFVTASKTFSGPAIFITQLPHSATDKKSNPTPTPSADPQPKKTPAAPSKPSAVASSKAKSTAASESATSTAASTAAQTTAAVTSPAVSSVVASSAPSSTVGDLAAGAASSSSATPDAATSTSSGGLSSGGKAGLAIGIILALGAILAFGLFFYRRKKALNDNHERLDDEKGHMTNEFPMTTAGAVPRQRNQVNSFAPRLSLRPVTQFLPGLGSDRRSRGNMLDVPTPAKPNGAMMAGGAGAAAGARGLRQPGASADALPQQQQPASPWEKVGQRDHANDPNNPFGNHAETAAHSPQANLAPAPVSPTRDVTSNVADAAIAPIVGAAAGAAVAHNKAPSNDGSVIPKPLSIKSNMSGVVAAPGPPSPALTDTANANASTTDVPSSLVAGGAAAGGAPGPNNVHRVQMDFKPSMDDEVELRAGQLIRMLHAYDDGWVSSIVG
jgi:hypothetical protein